MKENKEFYVTIQGKKVFVSEEVYREYVRPIRAIQRQQRRAWKCRIVGRKGNLIRCPYKCEECPYAIAGKLPTGNVLSLDKFKEMGVEILDKEFDLERMYIEKEDGTSYQAQVHKAISQLTLRQQEMVRLIYFEGKAQEDLTKYYGVSKQAISNAMQRIYASLKKNLEKN